MIQSPNALTLPDSPELQLATELALQAGVIMLRYFDGDQQEQTKGDGTPVTIADKMINSETIRAITNGFPDDGVVGEEESSAEYSTGRRWICDPIDGTAGLVMGVPTSMYSLSLVVDGVPTVAVAYEPHSEQMYRAVRGHGSECNGVRLQVSADTMENGLIALPPDYIRPGRVDLPFMQRLLKYDKQLAIFPGAVFRSCMIAKGRIAGFPHPEVKPYDIAAVHLIVEEAGGKVTGVHGEPLDYTSDFRGAVISNSVVHDNLVALFSED